MHDVSFDDRAHDWDELLVPWTSLVLGTPGGKWSLYLWSRDQKSVVWLHRMGLVASPRPIFGQRVLGQIRRTTNHEEQAIGFSLLYDHPVYVYHAYELPL
jgi:hypothetical protein